MHFSLKTRKHQFSLKTARFAPSNGKVASCALPRSTRYCTRSGYDKTGWVCSSPGSSQSCAIGILPENRLFAKSVGNTQQGIIVNGFLNSRAKSSMKSVAWSGWRPTTCGKKACHFLGSETEFNFYKSDGKGCLKLSPVSSSGGVFWHHESLVAKGQA